MNFPGSKSGALADAYFARPTALESAPFLFSATGGWVPRTRVIDVVRGGAAGKQKAPVMKSFQKTGLFCAVATAIVNVILLVPYASAASLEAKTQESTAWATTLDGKSFRSRQYGDDGTPRPWDMLLFKDGKFISENCKPYGFVEGPYWLRFDGDSVHFFAELKSPTHGTMVWKGTVKGDKIEGNLVWTRERWYWTIRRTFNFAGSLEK